jgi:PTS system fructose-specific IIC component/PTS system nitrogen regulatory IIA component
MLLYEIFPVDLIKVGVESEDKDEVFEELVDLFCAPPATAPRRDTPLSGTRIQDVHGPQKGIALPHGKTNAVDKVYGVLGVSRKESTRRPGRRTVPLLFMMLVPKGYRKTLAPPQEVAELLDNPLFTTRSRSEDAAPRSQRDPQIRGRTDRLD